jgi:hypothetical protein
VRGREHQLEGRHHARGPRARQEALAEHAGQVLGQAVAHLVVGLGLVEREDALDRLRRVDRVQRREHQVARLGRVEGGGDGLGIAHLADQDHVRALAQRVPQAGVEGLEVGADLALADHAELLLEEQLDRILERHDVALDVLVHVLDQARQRGRLARAGDAGDEHQAAPAQGQLLELLRRQLELVEAGRVLADPAHDDRRLAHLLVGIEPEAAQAVEVQAGIGGAVLVPVREALGTEDPRQDLEQGAGRRHAAGEEADAAVDADARAPVGAQDQVARPLLDHRREPGLELVARRDVGARELRGLCQAQGRDRRQRRGPGAPVHDVASDIVEAELVLGSRAVGSQGWEQGELPAER